MNRELNKKTDVFGHAEPLEETQNSIATSGQYVHPHVDPSIARFLTDSEKHLRGYN